MERIISLIRYRFFLFAGICPYLLGQAIARSCRRSLDWQNFWLGLLGIFLALCGVELFNEYFDAREGTDRIFLQENVSIPRYFYALGVLVFAGAFCVGIYFTLQLGWPIFLFSFLGFFAAYFYVGPPLRLAYRGLGEITIALAYGPFMLLGSFYLQTKRIDLMPFFVSSICALAIFCLAVINEIPDYYQDRLAGKRNLVVKLGREKAIRLSIFSLLSLFLILTLGIILKKIPLLSALACLILPWTLRRLLVAQEEYDNPKAFLSIINVNIATYLVIVFSLGIGYSLFKM